MRIIVLGYIVRGPMGGMAASNVQYLTGLARLGHDVCFLEYGNNWDCCYDPSTGMNTPDATYGLAFIQNLLTPFGLQDRWGYFDAHKNQWLGPLTSRIDQVIADADLVLNLCGMNDIAGGLEAVPLRVLVEEDPVFTQIKHLQDPERKEKSLRHNHFFTFASNWGQADCTVPDDGIDWRPTRPPVVVDLWPNAGADPTRKADRYTTVMQWRSYAPLSWAGTDYHNKDHSMPAYMGLPKQTDAVLEIALAGADAEQEKALIDAGWRLTEAGPVSVSLPAYRDYLAQSRGEFAVAKHAYVAARTGWFSERSACYLACGLPVIIQDTGFSDWLPNDSAIAAFTNPEQALQQLNRIEADYPRYCREARNLADTYFGSDTVLTQLLNNITASSSAS